MLSGGGILGSSDMVSEFVSMHAWSVIRSCCSFTLSPPPKDHLKGIVLAPLVLVLLILSPWRICLKGMQICESPAVYPIISLPCRSLSQSHHHDTFFLFIKWFHGAFVYWNIQLIYRNFNLLCKCFFRSKKGFANVFLPEFFGNTSCPQFGQFLCFLCQTHKEHCANFAASILGPNPNEHAWKAGILFSTITFVCSVHHVLSWYFSFRWMFRSSASL